jgi:hypothetical protein
MDINDVISRPVNQAPSPSARLVATSTSALKPSPGSETRDTITIASPSPSSFATEATAKINDAISASNVVESTLDDLSKITSTLEDLASAAQKDPTTAQSLEVKANDLAETFRQKTKVVVADGTKPLAGDTIRVKVEQQLGPTLSLVFPDKFPPSLDLGYVQFSPPQAIIDTITRIQTTRENIQALRDSVRRFSDDVTKQAKAIVIARENGDASHASVDDVDNAVDLAATTKDNIGNNPSTAINAFRPSKGTSGKLLDI